MERYSYSNVDEVNLVEINEICKGVNTLSIIESKEPNLQQIDKGGKRRDYSIIAFIINYKSSQVLFDYANKDVCAVFASDLFELEPTWKFLDIVNYWKFIKEKGLKPFGKITLAQLHDWRNEYNLEIAEKREQYHLRLKAAMNDKNMNKTLELSGINPNKILLGKMADEAATRNERKRK